MMRKAAWGIDVSKTSAKVVRLERDKVSVVLTHADIFRYKPAESVDEQIRNALKELKFRNRINERVIVSIPTHAGINRRVRLPQVEESRLADQIRHEAKNEIPMELSEVCWGHILLSSDGSAGEREVIFVAIKQDIVEQFLQNIGPVGLNVEAIQLSPVALSFFLAFDQDKKINRVVLDLGAENSSLIVMEDSKFWVTNISVTGNDITKAIATTFNLTMQRAEQVKVSAKDNKHLDKIYQAMLPVYQKLVNEVQRFLGHYKGSISRQAKFDELMVLGNGSKCVNLERYLSQSLQLPSRKLAPSVRIELADQIDPQAYSANIGTLGTAIGLALQGIGLTQGDVNLLPKSAQEKKIASKRYPLVIGTFVCIYVILALFYLGTLSELNRWRVLDSKASNSIKTERNYREKYEKEKDIKPYKEALEKVELLNIDPNVYSTILERVFKPLPDSIDGKISDKDKIWVLKLNAQTLPQSKVNEQEFPTSRYVEIVLELAVSKFEVDKIHSAGPSSKERSKHEGLKMVGNYLLNIDKSPVKGIKEFKTSEPNPLEESANLVSSDIQETHDKKKNFLRYGVKITALLE